MATLFKRWTALLLPLAAALAICTSCIFDAPGDRFYRTLWVSSNDDTALGSVTLEFLCGGQISVTSPSAIGSFGSYESEGMQAWFTDLTLTLDNTTAVLVEAHRSGDSLCLIWFDETALAQYTTELHRLSAYPQ